MTKYYVQFGKHTVVLLASTDIQACILVFKRLVSRIGGRMPVQMRVSRRGFDNHVDDVYYSTQEVISLIAASNECEVDDE